MIAMDRGRKIRLVGVVLAAALFVGLSAAQAPQDGQEKYQVPPPAPRITSPAPKTAGGPKHLRDIDMPGLTVTQIPVNPSDAILKINGQIITRQQLADECVAREGKKIAELMINRTLVEQALRARKLEVTGTEIDQEIEGVAHRFGISREGWLRTLDKERGISPVQYARDIIYPALALRKLCSGRVQVTPDDMKKAFEAQFSEKLRCRMIMVDKQSKAMDIWERLKKNPGGFEKIAQDESLDTGSRSLGGLLSEPMTRHAYPVTISEAAFQQLVDGDPIDKDPSHKPKNGDFTGPIQAGEMAWIILRRESVIPAVEGADLKDERVRKQTYEMIYEVKLKEAMGLVFQELLKAAAIENQLTGQVKLAHEEKDPDFGVDKDVKLMSNPPASQAAGPVIRAGAAGAGAVKTPLPVALPKEAAEQFERLQRTAKPSTKNDAAGTPTGDAAKSPN
jgi:parvulin-like peptidyl-prolyl isomerase